MADLFDRICIVTLQRTAATSDPRRFGTPAGPRIEIRDLRVQFQYKRTLGKSPNECKATITNLSEAMRSEVEGPPEGLVMSLAAGHAGVARYLFQGNVALSYSEKMGADWETKFTVLDGGRAFANTRLATSYRAGTPLIRALRDLAAEMGVAFPESIANDPAFQGQFSGGMAMRDLARDELTKLLGNAGYSWSVQDGRLQILDDTKVAPFTEREISTATGMIGSPTFERTKGSKKKRAITKMQVNSILYPELVPGGLVRLDSLSHKARFRIEQVEGQGDTHGDGEDSWTTSVEAKEIG